MCRRLFFLIAVLGLVSTVWADDWNIPPWRGDEKTTLSYFTYDNAPLKNPTGELQAPDASSYWGDAEHLGMPGNFLERAELEEWIQTWWEPGGWVDDSAYYADNFAMQVWTGEPPPAPVWTPIYMGRTGVMVNMQNFSYDVYNYDSAQPWKFVQVQLTWQPMDDEIGADVDGYEVEWNPGPWVEDIWWVGAGAWGGGVFNGGWGSYSWWEAATWNTETWWEELWWEAPFWEGPGWHSDIYQDWGYLGEFAGDGDPLSHMIENELQPDGWIHSKFYYEFKPNPDIEFLGFFFTDPIALDQVVIDTICIPEPFTISLLGLGGLLLIRRRKR